MKVGSVTIFSAMSFTKICFFGSMTSANYIFEWVISRISDNQYNDLLNKIIIMIPFCQILSYAYVVKLNESLLFWKNMTNFLVNVINFVS